MTNETITYTHQPEAYKAFANFTQTKELNTSFEMWLADHKKKFGKKELQALKTLIRHSVRVAGIATIKFKNLVRVAAEKFGFHFDLRTAKRAVAKAKKLGMLMTLETRKANTNLKGPSIYVWQPYQCQNVTTKNEATQIEKIAQECDELKHRQQQEKKKQAAQTKPKMSPHKSIITKAIRIKLLNTYQHACKTITQSMAIKNQQTISLLTQPVKRPDEIAPLKFISRLKQVMYRSTMNHQSDVKAVTEMIYGKVHRYTKEPIWKEHKDTMLEHSLRIVEACLTARKNKQLNHIKSMRGFINNRLNEEINAYIELQREKLTPQVSPQVSQMIIDLYTAALEKK